MFDDILTASPRPLPGGVSTALPPAVPSLARGLWAPGLGVIRASSLSEADLSAIERGRTPGWHRESGTSPRPGWTLWQGHLHGNPRCDCGSAGPPASLVPCHCAPGWDTGLRGSTGPSRTPRPLRFLGTVGCSSCQPNRAPLPRAPCVGAGRVPGAVGSAGRLLLGPLSEPRTLAPAPSPGLTALAAFSGLRARVFVEVRVTKSTVPAICAPSHSARPRCGAAAVCQVQSRLRRPPGGPDP